MNYLKSAISYALLLGFIGLITGSAGNVVMYAVSGILAGLILELFFWNRRRRGLSEGEEWIMNTWLFRLTSRLDAKLAARKLSKKG